MRSLVLSLLFTLLFGGYYVGADETVQDKPNISSELKKLIFIQLPRLDPIGIINKGSIVAVSYNHPSKTKEYKNEPDITVLYKGKTGNPSSLPCHKIYQPDETFSVLGYGFKWDLKREICHWDGKKVYISDIIPLMVKFGKDAKSANKDIQLRENAIAKELMMHHEIKDLR